VNGGFGFHGSDSGEGPTRSTLSLIFDFLDVSFGGPINGGVDGVVEGDGLGIGGSFLVSEEDGFEFFGGHVSEFVEGIDDSVVGVVHFLDFVEVVGEDLHSVEGFFFRVKSVLLGGEFFEFVGNGWGDGGALGLESDGSEGE